MPLVNKGKLKMKLPVLVGALSVLWLMAGMVRAETTCTITEKMQCAQGQGCQSVKNTIVVRIDMERRIYSRCDAKGCDDLQAQFSNSGTFTNIAVPQSGLLSKLTTDGSSFTEVATFATFVLVSFGYCR